MIDNEELVDIKRVIRSRKFMNRPKVMGQKYKQCYSKHYNVFLITLKEYANT
jgi:hypothetical protein